ncbi:hypothetical protein TrVE_jg3315 [Triparma verrucosa]|uniref:Kinesin motor domain-containing protein n=1 Tax=Triparma verrucosa TaxID=1606542 RepID=A0A9W7FF74_9STRA|nr:hypothetical protein TrVE_jg3315 [Triparma verrucosa]
MVSRSALLEQYKSRKSAKPTSTKMGPVLKETTNKTNNAANSAPTSAPTQTKPKSKVAPKPTPPAPKPVEAVVLPPKAPSLPTSAPAPAPAPASAPAPVKPWQKNAAANKKSKKSVPKAKAPAPAAKKVSAPKFKSKPNLPKSKMVKKVTTGFVAHAPPTASANDDLNTTVESRAPPLTGGLMMMFSPSAHVSESEYEKSMKREKFQKDRQRDHLRTSRVEKMKGEGMLMTFSPPNRNDQIQAEMAKEASRRQTRQKNAFSMSFTPGGTLQSDGLDMDSTPEELRRMRERIRLQEERENPSAAEPAPDLALALGDDMDAEVSLTESLELSPEKEAQPAMAPTTPFGGHVYDVELVDNVTPEPPKSLVKAKQELQDTLEQLIGAEKCNAELSEALKISVEEKENLVKANDELLAVESSMEAEINALKQQNDKMSANLKNSSESIVLLKKQVAALKQTIKDLNEASASSASASNKKMAAENQDLQNTIAMLKKKLAAKAEDSAQLQSANATILTLKKKLASKSESESVELQNANSTIAALETRVKTLDAQTLVTTNNLITTKKQLAAAQEDLKTTSALRETCDSVKAKLTQEIAKSKSLQKKIDEESSSRASEKKQLHNLMSEVNSYSNKSEELLSALTGEKNGNKAMQTKLTAAVKEKNAALERVRTFDEREAELMRQLQFMDDVRRKLHNRVMQLTGNIRVFVRVRPMLSAETEDLKNMIVKKGTPKAEIPFMFPGVCEGAEGIDSTKRLLEMQEPWKDRGGLNPRRKQWRFGFDSVFSPEDDQLAVWEAAEPLVQSAIDGSNVCFFAYGQTGSGKTHTMLGSDECKGLVFRSVEKIFSAKNAIEADSKSPFSVELKVEMLEIYNEKVNDLLTKKTDELVVSDGEVVGSRVVGVRSPSDVAKILTIAQNRRATKATNSNDTSSRSHLVFTIVMEVKHSSDENLNRTGRLHICDLAGSERLSKSKSNESKELLKETQAINSSLLNLSNVIEKLQKGGDHVPFRDSKLTYLLQNSLGGDSKTLAIVCCSPVPSSWNESLCSLRFASKVNKVELQKETKFSA